MKTSTKSWKPMAGGAALLLGGMAVGAVALGSTAATAADSTTPLPSASQDSQPGGPTGRLDPSQPMRSDEELLTGATAKKVTAAALAEYPGATIQRVETDSDGVYEAHLVTAGGDELIVQVGADFAVTGTQSMGAPGGAPPAQPDPSATASSA